MKISSNIAIKDYIYDLPKEKIAYQPASDRDKSNLLIYKQDETSKDVFENLADYLPSNCLMVFNNTRVIQARLIFRKPTGARIEIFCLEPIDKQTTLHEAYNNPSPVMWKCLVGNAKKWKEGVLEKTNPNGKSLLRAEKIGTDKDTFLIKFTWEPSTEAFANILGQFGRIPLPPYIQREDNPDDKIRYQTLYGNMSGSVAAPTAGLHFSDNTFKAIKNKNITTANVTLHVGAGTFKPVTTEHVDQHKMHDEQFSVSLETIETLIEESQRPFIIVGTTTVRTLESLYWFGIKLLKSKAKEQQPVCISQWEPYQYDLETLPSRKEVLKNLMQWMQNKNLENITGTTSLMIVPGYRYQITDILITNFHQPASTLLLLVAAFIGDDWRRVYNYALNNDFRFLSYGDSCLLFKKQNST